MENFEDFKNMILFVNFQKYFVINLKDLKK